jgi:hypothetical protein
MFSAPPQKIASRGLYGCPDLPQIVRVQKLIVLIAGGERRTEFERGQWRKFGQLGWPHGLPTSENGVLQPAHALGQKRGEIVVKEDNVFITHLFDLIGRHEGYPLLRNALRLVAPSRLLCERE